VEVSNLSVAIIIIIIIIASILVFQKARSQYFARSPAAGENLFWRSKGNKRIQNAPHVNRVPADPRRELPVRPGSGATLPEGEVALGVQMAAVDEFAD